MTIILAPETEAMLHARAEREGQDASSVADTLLANVLAQDQAEELAALRAGLESSDAGRVRPFSEFAAEMRTKYNLPAHLSDEEIFAEEEGLVRS